jgi:transglutaminase-like putative cysteine protease
MVLDDPYQETALYYLVNRYMAGDEFTYQLFGAPVRLVTYELSEHKLYFAFSKNVPDKKAILAKLTSNPDAIEEAPCQTGYCQFGPVKGDVDTTWLVRFPVKNLKVNKELVLSTPLKQRTYLLPITDLVAAHRDEVCYHTEEYIQVRRYFGTNQNCYNQAAYVSKAGDPSLTRLVKTLTKNIPSKEQQAQVLLDLVSGEIDYSYLDWYAQSEVMKRAHEVLMTGSADCSGKSILYASLLEQCGIPYALCYLPGHLSVAVKGNFPAQNKMSVNLKDEAYYFAETTAEGFKIGLTELQKPYGARDILFYQIPGKDKFARDYKTGVSLEMSDRMYE